MHNKFTQKVGEYDQETSQLQTMDEPTAPRKNEER